MYLLDGNNIMGQRVGWHRDKAAARQRLIDELQRFATRMETEVAVVFDAPPGKSAQRFGRLEAFYARTHESADDCILDLVKRRRGDPGLIAVTSDRELAQRIAKYGVKVTRSGEFRRMLDSHQFPPA